MAHAAACCELFFREEAGCLAWNKTTRNGALSGEKVGRKLSAQLFQESMFFLMVLASRPLPAGVLAICCEYQTSECPGLFLRNAS